MTKRSNILVVALVSAGFVGCASNVGGPMAWKPGNSKFTVGLHAPSVTPVDAAARERTATTPK